MEFDLYKNEAESGMQNTIISYKHNLSKILVGRANPQILGDIKINYYGTLTLINQVAAVSIPEPRQLLIKPYDVSNIKDIVGAINLASLGVDAINEGDQIRITFPKVTTERRKELVKSLINYTEQAKITIRLLRQDANKAIKLAKNFSEDKEREHLQEIQNLTNQHIDEINFVTKEKEQDLMSM